MHLPTSELLTMHPLTFLQASLFPLPSSAHSPSHPHPSSPACKAVPGSANWPSTAKWAALNESLDGRLLKPSPPGAVCHPERPEYDAAACAAVKEDWVLVDWYATEPIGAAWSNWDNDSCVPFLPVSFSVGGWCCRGALVLMKGSGSVQRGRISGVCGECYVCGRREKGGGFCEGGEC